MLKYFLKNTVFKYLPICRHFYFESLKSRSLIEIVGTDCKNFLQGLITNDMNGIGNSHGSIYSLLLNSKGRVLYDVILYGNVNKMRNENQFFIECDSRIADSLIKHLSTYKLRKKIELKRIVDGVIFVISRENDSEILESLKSPLIQNPNLIYFGSDPRIKSWILRCVGSDQSVISIMRDMKEAPVNSYLENRLAQGICEGADEFEMGQMLPLEFNGDIMNGISFSKGCYIGQELTARTFHTGVVRKRVMPVRFERSLFERLRTVSSEKGKIDLVDNSGAQIGQLRSFDACGRGLAVVRLSSLVASSREQQPTENSDRIFQPIRVESNSGLVEIVVSAPAWWPRDVVLPPV